MTMAPLMSAAGEYADHEATVGMIADQRFDPAGPGGAKARMSAARRWLGQGAYETYGWFGDMISAGVAGQGTGLSQAASIGMGAGTAAILGNILPMMAPMLGITNPAVLGALPGVHHHSTMMQYKSGGSCAQMDQMVK